MNPKRTLRRVGVALMLLVAFLFQGTWALAGTTGGIAGYVRETSGAPVADATLKAVSPSGVATSRTDATGHFNFLSLSPDTYTITVSKEGFADESVPGVVVFADQTQTLNITQDKKLATIARVKSVSAGSLVKSGVTADQYSVDSTGIAKAAALGGGGNLDSAYSAIASVPGVNVPIGGMGWNSNAVYIRGSQSFFTSYEYDGVPVNRAFDNYNSSTESNLGLQELQVYTGGGPASNSSSGTSGFINQVIKTGTYPGYATLSGGLASNAFYHMAKVEAGGATPDRNFSYYVGVSGYNQAFRFLDNNNGAGLMGPGGIYSDYSNSTSPLGSNIAASNGAYAQCDATTGATPVAALTAANSAQPGGNPLLGAPYSSFCLYPYTGISGLTSFISDRENVVNFHFGIPRKNGLRDDLQLLWSGSAMKTYYYGSVNDVGGVNAYSLAQDGVPYTPNPNPGGNLPVYNLGGLYTGNNAALGCIVLGTCSYPFYSDAWVYNASFGQNIQNTAPTLYYSPDSTGNRTPWAQLPSAAEDAIYNDTGIVKAQYTHALSDRAYASLSAYTFYSDWNQTGQNSQAANYIFGYPAQALAANYILSTHTLGADFNFNDQINDKNLVGLSANYTQANVLRDNNNGFPAGGALGSAGPIGLFTGSPTAGFTCYNPGSGAVMPCSNYVAKASYARQYSAAQVENGFFNPAGGPPAGSAAALAGANYSSLWDGPTKGAYNTVDPKFVNVALTDQLRPNDHWLFNAGLRYESYTYNLPNSTTLADQFYGQITEQNTCYQPSTGTVFSAPLVAGQYPPANPLYTVGDCNAAVSGFTGSSETGWVHPNGQTQDGTAAPTFTTNSPSSYNLHYWSARLSGTYTQSPDTVWRFEGGRYIEPPISASVQYLDQSGNNTGLWANFMQLGFFSPFHNVPAQTSGQYDISLERHIRGTDVSFKLSPFYNITNGYQEQSFIGSGFVTQVPVGRFRSYGVEASLTKGDFSRNGLSGQLALTYTNAKEQFQAGLVNNKGANQIGLYNQSISEYNALAAGGSKNYSCFTPASYGAAGTGVGAVGVAAACPAGDIANPYFASRAQALLDPNGWYAPASDVALSGVNTGLGLYDAPWISSLILNYRHNKLAITPSLQFVSGSSYGSPFAVQGVDPRDCSAVDTSAGAAPNQCAYTSLVGAGATTSGILYVPNWQTGSFDSVGQYRNPNLITGNLAVSYDLTPRVSLNLTLANIFHRCFGGTKTPWTSAYPPSSSICGYGANGLQVSNYQLGSGYANPGSPAAYSAAANGTTLYPWQFQSYAPSNGSAAGTIPAPFNAYLSVQIKL